MSSEANTIGEEMAKVADRLLERLETAMKDYDQAFIYQPTETPDWGELKTVIKAVIDEATEWSLED